MQVSCFHVLKDCNAFTFMGQPPDPWRWRHCNPPKCQKTLSQQKSITSHNAWIQSNTNVKTLNPAKLVHFWGMLHFENGNFFCKTFYCFNWPEYYGAQSFISSPESWTPCYKANYCILTHSETHHKYSPQKSAVFHLMALPVATVILH